MKDNFDPIADALEMDSNNLVKRETIVSYDNDNDNLDEELVRNNLKSLMNTANEAIDDLAKIAHSSQDHESYSSLASLIRAADGLNKTLLNAGMYKREKTNITNNTLVLSTAELQKLIESKK